MHHCFAKIKKLVITLVVTIAPFMMYSQRAIVNSASTFYQIGSSGSLCATTTQYSYCNPNAQSNFLLSSALYKDTLFFVSNDGRLFRMRIGDTGSCLSLATFPSNGSAAAMINSLVISRSGILYAADGVSKNLYAFNLQTRVRTDLGVLNATPSGDMIFYKNKLLLAATDGNICEVNINNPSASTVYISAVSGKVFNGLISIPNDCFSNKYYAFENVTGLGIAHTYEIDMVNRAVLPVGCDFTFTTYDGASNTDDGSTLGITVDTMIITPPCGRNGVGTAVINASTASSGLEFTLNGTTTNTTGVFNNLPVGSYTLSMKNSRGCTKDTTFTIAYGIYPTVTIDKWRATNCTVNDGRIIVHARSNYLPLQFSNNNGSWTTDSSFTNLSGSVQLIRIRDARGCIVDSNYVLGYITVPNYFSSIQLSPSFCERKNGSFTIVPSAGYTASSFSISVDAGAVINGVTISGLDAGTHLVKISYQSACTIDTLITIAKDKNPAPAITLTTVNQRCSVNNGSIGIALNGSYSPYEISVDALGFSSATQYANLPVGPHTIQIKDVDGCLKDTFATVLPYVVETISTNTTTTNPSCRTPNSGSIKLSIIGARSPYRYSILNRSYSNNTAATGLEEGVYAAYIFNADDCLIDSVTAISIVLPITPDCEDIYIPTGFTPNGDGLNDLFKPFAGSFVSAYKFSIFNRYGEPVFSTTDKRAGWDGNYKGQKQSTDVFTWIVQYNTVNNSKIITKQGTMVLVK